MESQFSSPPSSSGPAQHQWLQPIQTTVNSHNHGHSHAHAHSPYASPTSALPSPSESSYASIYGNRAGADGGGGPPGSSGGLAPSGSGGPQRTPSSLSLNMSGLSVASPATLSPHPSAGHPPSTAGSMSSPITPGTPHAHLGGAMLSAHAPSPAPEPGPGSGSVFRFGVPMSQSYEVGHTNQPSNGIGGLYAPPGSSQSPSRSPSASDRGMGGGMDKGTSSNPRKRSAGPTHGNGIPLSVDTFETPHHPYHNPLHHQSQFDDTDMAYGNSSPMDDSPSSTSFPDDGGIGGGHGGAGTGAVMAQKQGTTNNFVTKLYQMINDPKSTRFINWTEHGTSFVVSNVGEFSRSILGAHFKHNNFSSFVRQLNMYGFSKINRTPRAQRASTDQQTWEFAHAKFLRGRPDLLDEIRRKALEPDPSLKQRVELPAELASQLSYIREENRRVTKALSEQRERNVKLAGVVKGLFDFVGGRFGDLSIQFPMDLLTPPPIHTQTSGDDNPPIYITSPINSSPTYAPSSAGGLYHISPQSSPTTTEFPHNSSQRGLSLPHINALPHHHHHPHHPQMTRYNPSVEEPDPKRQRTAGTGRVNRARSDSAPQHHVQQGSSLNAWADGGHVGGRPRSGSGLGLMHTSYHPGAGGSLGIPVTGSGLGVTVRGEEEGSG